MMAARRDAGISFLDDAARTISYEMLKERVEHVSCQFRLQGVQTDTRVLIVVLTDIEHVVACLALMHIGAVPVSVKPPKGLSDAYREYLTRIADTFGITYGYHTLPLPTSVRPLRSSAGAPYKAARASLPHQLNPDDVVFIQFSSGSVSAPKAIPITRRALAANISAILRWDGRHSDSGLFCQMPLSHDMGFVGGLLSSLCSQNPLILTPGLTILQQTGSVSVRGPDAAD